ncbi:MAG: CoA-binding protein [Pseudomonadota bacterium]
MHRLDYIFRPRSIAVVGASDNPGKIGFRYVSHIKEGGYPGKIYPLNPRGGDILGMKVYPNLDAIDDAVDMAVILTGAATVPHIMQDCVRKGVKGVVLITAGFSETGEQGKRLETEVLEIARQGGIRVVGPNCLGVVNTGMGLNCTAIPFVPRKKGNMGFISQSGSSLELLFSWTLERGIYFNKVVSSGNEADLKLNDYLDYFADDPEIEVIMLYIEGLDRENGRRFLDLASRTSRKKPIVALKSGRTRAGAEAIKTHTGALGGRPEIYSALFRQCGITEAKTYEALFDYGLAFSGGRLPRGNRVAILGPGGPGVNAADTCEESGVKVGEFSPRTREKLKGMMPGFMAAVKNPLDLSISAAMDQREKFYEALLEDETCDGAIFLTSAIFYMKKFTEIMKRLYAGSSRPLLIGAIMSTVLPEMLESARTLGEAGIPFYPSPERAAGAYAALVRRSDFLRKLNDEGGILEP